MRKLLCGLLTGLMLLSLVGCGSQQKPETPVTEPEPVVKTTPNPLTGEPLTNASAANNRPVAVMLNNLQQALPQLGNSQADIIYECIVEGGITRMCAVYQDVSTVGTIGTLRSARPCFVEIAAGLDAFYVHAGGSTEAKNDISNWGIDDLDGCGAEEDYFWRDEARWASAGMEHSMMTSGENITEYLKQSGLTLTHQSDFKFPVTFVEDGTPTNGTDATNVTVQFTSYKTGVFTYDPATKLYQITEFDEPYIDGNTNQQVGVTNLLVLNTSVVNSGDAAGHMIVDLQGSGSGRYFCGGKVADIQWTKDSVDEPFRYTLADGSAFSMGIGKTYVCIISDSSSTLTIA